MVSIDMILEVTARLDARTLHEPDQALDACVLEWTRELEQLQPYEPVTEGQVIVAGRCLSYHLQDAARREMVWRYVAFHRLRLVALSVVVH